MITCPGGAGPGAGMDVKRLEKMLEKQMKLYEKRKKLASKEKRKLEKGDRKKKDKLYGSAITAELSSPKSSTDSLDLSSIGSEATVDAADTSDELHTALPESQAAIHSLPISLASSPISSRSCPPSPPAGDESENDSPADLSKLTKVESIKTIKRHRKRSSIHIDISSGWLPLMCFD